MAVIIAVAATGLGIGVWNYSHRVAVRSQLAVYRIGQARSFDQAKHEIASVEQQPNSEESLRELVSAWRGGNQTFDFYLADYLDDPQSSDELRRLFSLELSWHSDRLADWAHFWSWRSRLAPAEEIASIADYLGVLSAAADGRALTWREVLDFQATLALTGRADLARRLGPDNWQDRYQAWNESSPDFTRVNRPDRPLPGWQGSAPASPR
ncbi:MAG TPA: hypothetical protein VG826_06355 [Pirellulales bacterium]|nr:hypothetical protein [Pirellulales bacterium]